MFQIALGLMIATRGKADFPNVMIVFIFFIVAKLTIFVAATYELMENPL